MSLMDDLNKEIHEWDKMEGASAIYLMFGWGKPKNNTEDAKSEASNTAEEPDYRDRTHGDRNAKYLEKARFYANTPAARLKKERTLERKDTKR